MIYPKKPTKKTLLNTLNYYSKKEFKVMYRMLIEFDSNKHTSDLREFLLNHYKGEK